MEVWDGGDGGMLQMLGARRGFVTLPPGLSHSREIWRLLRALSWRGFFADDVWVWIQGMARGENGVKFLGVLWGVWKWRNNMVFESSPWPLQEAWRRISHEVDEIRLVNNNNVRGEMGDWLTPWWVAPPHGVLKLNTNSSFNPDSNLMGAGGVCRDDQGRWVCGFVNAAHGGSALVAEAVALRDGLAMMWGRGLKQLECEVDSMELIEAIGSDVLDRFVPEIIEIKLFVKRQWQVVVKRIPRESNRVANAMAKEATVQLGHRQVMEPWPDLKSLLMKDYFSAL